MYKELKVQATKATNGWVTVKMVEEVPNVFAQYIGAILCTNHRKDKPNQFQVEKVVLGYNLFNNKNTVAGYCDVSNTIMVDIYKVCIATMVKSVGRMDYRFFAFRVLLEAFCHEAIHARNAAMYPEKYEYGIIGDRSQEAITADEENAQEEKNELLYTAMDTFDISPTAAHVVWFNMELKKAAWETGLDESKLDYEGIVYRMKDGYRCFSWREFLKVSRLADTHESELLPLPDLVGEDFEVKEKVEVEPVKDVEVNMYDSEGFLKPEFVFEDEGVDNCGTYEEDKETFAPPADGHGGVPQNNTLTQNPEPVYEPEQKAVPMQELTPDMDMERLEQIVKDNVEVIYKRCYNHFYSKCGWDGQGNFTNLEGIKEPIFIGDLPYRNMLKEVHSVDEYGRRAVYRDPGDFIKGIVAGNAGLPMFHLVFDFFGQRVERRVVPQNPNPKTGIQKWQHTAVRNGEKLAWVIDHNCKEGSPFTHKINNGILTKIKKKKGGN